MIDCSNEEIATLAGYNVLHPLVLRDRGFRRLADESAR